MTLRNAVALSPFVLAAAAALTPSSQPIAPATAPASAQERVKKKEAKDFPGVLDSARAAWEAGQFGKASAALKEATKLVAVKYRASLMAAFPAAPEGWTFKGSEQDEAAMMMMGFAGLSIEGTYTGPEKERVSVTLSVNSPMIQMMSMAFTNPALLGDEAEVIKYGKHKALLKTQGKDRYELSILIGDDLVQASSRNMSDDALLGLCNQAMVDKLEAALQN